MEVTDFKLLAPCLQCFRTIGMERLENWEGLYLSMTLTSLFYLHRQVNFLGFIKIDVFVCLSCFTIIMQMRQFIKHKKLLFTVPWAGNSDIWRWQIWNLERTICYNIELHVYIQTWKKKMGRWPSSVKGTELTHEDSPQT